MKLTEAITDPILLKLLRGDAKITMFKGDSDKSVKSGVVSFKSALEMIEKISLRIFSGKLERIKISDLKHYIYKGNYIADIIEFGSGYFVKIEKL